MPRRPRIHQPRGLYHVVLRGNNRQDVFLCPDDRRNFEALLQSALTRYDCCVHAYCWMTNHIHMVVQVDQQPLWRMIQYLASQYARRRNARLQHTGHVFERRHRALLVTDDSYLLSLVRYVHRNPISAGLAQRAGDYAWCSHREYLGRRETPWLTTRLTLSLLGIRLTHARRAFDRFVHDDAIGGDSVFDEGSDRNTRTLAEAAAPGRRPVVVSRPRENLDAIIERVCATHGVTEAALAAASRERTYTAIRARIALEVTRGGAATISELARRFNRSDAAIHRCMRRYRGASSKHGLDKRK